MHARSSEVGDWDRLRLAVRLCVTPTTGDLFDGRICGESAGIAACNLDACVGDAQQHGEERRLGHDEGTRGRGGAEDCRHSEADREAARAWQMSAMDTRIEFTLT